MKDQTPHKERDNKSESIDAELVQQLQEDSNKNTDYHPAQAGRRNRTSCATCTRHAKHDHESHAESVRALTKTWICSRILSETRSRVRITSTICS